MQRSPKFALRGMRRTAVAGTKLAGKGPARRGKAGREGDRMQTIIDRSVLEELRVRLRGIAYAPGDHGYDEGRQAFKLNAH